MRYFFSFIILISLVFSSTSYAGFFEEYVMGDDPEVVMIENIKLTSVKLSGSKEVSRFNNTAYFITNIKNEAVERYSSGNIPLYRMHDIIINLDSFVYAMNEYFSYQKRYEQTKKSIYKETANTYLEDARWAYARLSDSLRKSAY